MKSIQSNNLSWTLIATVTALRADNLSVPTLANTFYNQLLSEKSVPDNLLESAFDSCYTPHVQRAFPSLSKQIQRLGYIRVELLTLLELRLGTTVKAIILAKQKAGEDISDYDNLLSSVDTGTCHRVVMYAPGRQALTVLLKSDNNIKSFIDLKNIYKALTMVPTRATFGQVETAINMQLHAMLPDEIKHVTALATAKVFYVKPGSITKQSFMLIRLARTSVNKADRDMVVSLITHQHILWTKLANPYIGKVKLSTAMEKEILSACHWMPKTVQEMWDLHKRVVKLVEDTQSPKTQQEVQAEGIQMLLDLNAQRINNATEEDDPDDGRQRELVPGVTFKRKTDVDGWGTIEPDSDMHPELYSKPNPFAPEITFTPLQEHLLNVFAGETIEESRSSVKSVVVHSDIEPGASDDDTFIEDELVLEKLSQLFPGVDFSEMIVSMDVYRLLHSMVSEAVSTDNNFKDEIKHLLGFTSDVVVLEKEMEMGHNPSLDRVDAAAVVVHKIEPEISEAAMDAKFKYKQKFEHGRRSHKRKHERSHERDNDYEMER